MQSSKQQVGVVWWCNGSMSKLVIPKVLVQLQPGALPGNNLGQVVHTYVPIGDLTLTLSNTAEYDI